MKTPLPDFIQPADGTEAVAIQQQLREKLRITDDFGTPKTVLGVDVGYNLTTGMSRASIVLIDLATLTPLQNIVVETPTTFPYIPGLLSFREIPAILAAMVQLEAMPDILMVDGHGIAHPRRMGIAAHLGALLDMPSLGVAKKRLCGTHEDPADHKGATAPLFHRGEQIGIVLRSREGVKPLYISPGHRMGMESALSFMLHCLTRYRLPEPTRLADKFSKVQK